MSAYEFMAAEEATAVRNSWPTAAMCRALGVSRSGFHDFKTREPSARAQRRAVLAAKIEDVHKESKCRYGSPRVTRALRRQGETVSRKTVAAIMAERQLVARRKRKFRRTTDSRRTVRVAPNLLQRNFHASAPNQVWVTDVTALWTLAGWVYLAAIIDLFSRRVVGWAVSEHNDTELALLALRRALFSRKPDLGLVHHSDRGSPYASDDYIVELDRHRMQRSMSRKGDCWDNAVAESFFSTLEFECVEGHVFIDRTDASRVVGAFINGFYNSSRLHSTNGFVSPIEFEAAFFLNHKAA